MGLDSQLEIEAKFSAAAETPVPDLCQIDHIASVLDSTIHNLSATYYDTYDLRLTRAKITLRRRIGGKDDGWHLKLPSGDARKELRHELTEGPEVPPKLAAAVSALVRSAPLVPIAQVDNERHESILGDESNNAIAEFCDDHVSARSFLPEGTNTSWREWEIEVTETGQEAKLAESLIASATTIFTEAGAKTSTSPSKLVMALGDSANNVPKPNQLQLPDPDSPAFAVVSALKRNRDKIIAYDPKVRADEWDSIHQMRVATRELRSHLQTFSGILHAEKQEELSAELKNLATILGVARDAEVIAERFKLLATSIDSEVVTKADGDQLYASMRDEYRLAHQKVVKTLDDPRYFALLDLLDTVLSNPQVEAPASDEPPSQDILLGHLYRTFQQLRKRHKRAISAWNDRAIPLATRENYFHDMRKAAKKLRYAAEAVGDATDIDTTKLYKACKQLQTVLGDFQDSVTSRDKLHVKAEQARKAGADTFVYGVLYQFEHQISHEVLEDYDDVAKPVFKAFKELQKAQQKKSAGLKKTKSKSKNAKQASGKKRKKDD